MSIHGWPFGERVRELSYNFWESKFCHPPRKPTSFSGYQNWATDLSLISVRSNFKLLMLTGVNLRETQAARVNKTTPKPAAPVKSNNHKPVKELTPPTRQRTPAPLETKQVNNTLMFSLFLLKAYKLLITKFESRYVEQVDIVLWKELPDIPDISPWGEGGGEGWWGEGGMNFSFVCAFLLQNITHEYMSPKCFPISPGSRGIPPPWESRFPDPALSSPASRSLPASFTPGSQRGWGGGLYRAFTAGVRMAWPFILERHV